jgi:hypothetical protein
LFTTGYKRLAERGHRDFLIGWLWAACEAAGRMVLLLLLSYARDYQEHGTVQVCTENFIHSLKKAKLKKS